MFQCWFVIYSYIDLWEHTLWVLLLWRSFTKIGLVDYSLHFSSLHVISSRCQENQREAALLLGQFATTDPECKVGILYLFRCSFLLPTCTEFFKFNWWLFGGFFFLLLFVLPLLGFLCQFLFFYDFFPLLPERQQKLRTQIVYNGLPKFLGRLLYAYLHPLLGADELSG